MKKETKVKIAITIDRQILKAVDDILMSTNSNRSEFINRVPKNATLIGIKTSPHLTKNCSTDLTEPSLCS